MLSILTDGRAKTGCQVGRKRDHARKGAVM
jgi:hypothetical protein